MPDDPDKEPMPKGQVEFKAHSTFKTNERLHGWFIVADEAHKKAYTQPALPNLTDYAATLDVIWSSIYMIFSKEENAELKKHWDAYGKLKPVQEKDRIAMFNELRMINYLMRGYLQVRKYFFRFESTDVKSLMDAIESAQLGSGVFSHAGIKK